MSSVAQAPTEKRAQRGGGGQQPAAAARGPHVAAQSLRGRSVGGRVREPCARNAEAEDHPLRADRRDWELLEDEDFFPAILHGGANFGDVIQSPGRPRIDNQRPGHAARQLKRSGTVTMSVDPEGPWRVFGGELEKILPIFARAELNVDVVATAFRRYV